MPKLSKKLLNPEKLGYYINNLWSAFTLMGSKEDIRLLFKDLFTQTEYKMFAKRLEIARRLMGGERYEDIARALNVTPGTINRVSNILMEKGEGLRKADQKLKNLENKYLLKQQQDIKNLENPFSKKLRRKTLLGETLKVGVSVLDKLVSKKLKQKTADHMLSL